MVLRSTASPTRFVLIGPCAALGRAPTSDMVLQSPRASARHAEVRYRGDRWEIRDLASTNGTFRDGVRVSPATPVALTLGDTLCFGEAAEEWVVVDAHPPWPCLFDPRTGERRELEGGRIDERVELDLEAGWRDPDTGARLSHGAIVDGWLLSIPSADALATTMNNPVHLEQVTLTLHTSANAGHVDIRLDSGGWSASFPSRAWAVAVLTLARARTGTDEGWLSLPRICKRTGLDRKVLDVYLSRAREAVVRAGVVDGSGLIEVRSGERRLGLAPTRVRYA